MIHYRPIGEFPGYKVGDDGSVWSKWKRVWPKGKRGSCFVLGKTWNRLMPKLQWKGRLQVDLYRQGQKRQSLIHRLVLEAFVGPCPPGMECRHFPDRDPTNNRLDNLSWGTKSQNQQDRKVHGTAIMGSGVSTAKLKEKDIPTILKLRKDGQTQKEVALVFGVHPATIGLIERGKTWRHV